MGNEGSTGIKGKSSLIGISIQDLQLYIRPNRK